MLPQATTIFLVMTGGCHEGGGDRAAKSGGPSEGGVPGGQPVEIIPLEQYESRDVLGFKVLWHPDCLSRSTGLCRTAAASLEFDLRLMSERIPTAALGRLRSVPIVVSFGLPASGTFDGKLPVYHRSGAWLKSQGFDAAREGVVELCDVETYLDYRDAQPFLIVHEFAHALYATLDDVSPVADAYDRAILSGAYDDVRKVGTFGTRQRAYALTSAGEYFAETSEAFFGLNDFYPFTVDDLATADPIGLAVVSAAWGVVDPPRTGVVE